jgi:uncharacterized OB-fold protein
MTTTDAPFRILPELTDRNRHFWQGGRDGQLVFLRCRRCGYYLHPPIPICPRDQSKDIVPEAVSGRATVASFTVNHHQWIPGFDPPYVIALVSIAEQPELRLTTNIVHCPPEAVHIGMEVQVVFEHREDVHGDIWLPLFEPVADGAAIAGATGDDDA